MSLANNVYKVHYGYMVNGKETYGEFVDLVQAADSQESTIKTVLTNNGKARPGTSIQIHSVQNSQAGSSNVLS